MVYDSGGTLLAAVTRRQVSVSGSMHCPMGKIIRRTVGVLCAIPLLSVAAYFCLRGVAVWQKGYTWAQMDWNGDGSTSLGEYFQTSDIGRHY